MFNKPLIKYTLIFITVIVAGFGVYKTIESIVSVKIELDISIYSDCLPLSDAEVSFDGKLKGTTNSSGNIQFKINYDNDKPEKQVKISVGGQQWMEGIILKEENIGKTQERIIFFRQPSTDVMITPFPENISYSIMDMDTKCELYTNQIGLSIKRMIIDAHLSLMDREFKNAPKSQKEWILNNIQNMENQYGSDAIGSYID